ncbi:MAG: protein kinase [Phycisphaerales bacterium]|nr:MAG: protein kinase [Phycisphaerales bacterium]
MDAASLEETLAGLAAGRVDDEALLECARWALAGDGRVERLREAWPAETLPIIEDYFCVACLGQGASGAVFKALRLKEPSGFVALKLLQFSSPEQGDRFREREIGILKSLDCPYVARHLDSGSVGGMHYLVMELVAGRPLDEYLAECAPTLESKLAVFARVCRVVGGLHAKGVIHRDLKPKHVLVDRDGQPWIVDFGLSAVHSDEWPTRIRRAQTELGHILGTIKYMSPEQAWGGLMKVDHRSDIWSLGVMLYEIVTEGDYPYSLNPVGDMTGHDALLHRIQTETPKKPRIRGRAYGASLETLISRCLTYEREHRLESAAALADDVQRCLHRKPILTRRLPLGKRLRRIGIGLAANWRVGLWGGTVVATLVFLSLVSVVFGVRREAVAQDYGRDTRRALEVAGPAVGPQGFVIVGISEESISRVPELAAAERVQGVSRDIRTWRAMHGRIMERLGEAAPQAVLWDYYFRTAQPGDAAFVEGVRSLARAGVPVVLAVDRYRPEGRPDLSDALFGPIEDVARHGLILARDMVKRQGEFLMAMRRGENMYPAVVLAAFAAVVQPDCRVAIDWPAPSRSLHLVYRAQGGGRDPGVDDVGLTTVYEVSEDRLGTQRGDVLGFKAFPLERPEVWAGRQISYEKVLEATPEELRTFVSGKIVVIGDVRQSRLFFKADRYPVRYGTEIVEDVPGCYLLANAVSGLLANRYLKSESPLTKSAFVGVAVLALLACLVPPKLALWKCFGSVRGRVFALVVLAAGALGCTGVLVLTHSGVGVHAAMFGAAVCMAMAASFAIEFTRNRYRVPAMS